MSAGNHQSPGSTPPLPPRRRAEQRRNSATPVSPGPPAPPKRNHFQASKTVGDLTPQLVAARASFSGTPSNSGFISPPQHPQYTHSPFSSTPATHNTASSNSLTSPSNSGNPPPLPGRPPPQRQRHLSATDGHSPRQGQTGGIAAVGQAIPQGGDTYVMPETVAHLRKQYHDQHPQQWQQQSGLPPPQSAPSFHLIEDQDWYWGSISK